MLALTLTCFRQVELPEMQPFTVPNTSYLRGSDVFRSLPAQVSVKVREDICSMTAPLPRTTRADSGGFAMGFMHIHTYVLHNPLNE